MSKAAIIRERPQAPPPAARPVRSLAGWTVLAVVVALAGIVASLIVQKGSWLHGEADLFLVDHLSERSFLSKVICPHTHDASQYQARELSHVLEFFDAQFIKWSIERKMPHFYSITNYLLLFLISVLQFRFASKYLKLDPLVSVLLVALFWTTPCIFYSGQYLRSAKQGCAFFAFLLGWLVIMQAGPRRFPAALVAAQGFLFGLGLVWMDRQGFFILVAMILTLFLFAAGPPIPHRGILIGAMAAAAIAHYAYSKAIAPGLIRELTGFDVSFQYQKLPLGQFFKGLFGYLWQGLLLLGNNIRFVLGNITGGLALIACAAMAWLFSRLRFASEPAGRAFEVKRFAGLLFVFWLLLLLGMNALMVLRHEPLTWPDQKASYYWIPTTVLVLICVTLAATAAQRQLNLRRWLLPSILAALVFSNITALPEHQRLIQTGHLQGYIALGPHIRKGLKDLYNTQPGATPPAKKFDTKISSQNAGDFKRILQNPLAYPSLPPIEEFLFSSSFYNFLRSERNLEFRQP